MRSRTSIATSISAAKERGCQPSFRGIFHSLTCQLSSLPREELNHCNYTATRERPPHHQTRPRTGYIFFYLAERPKSPQPRATICFLTLAKLCHAFIRRTFKALWDANSTPVCWGCQEGIPIYCISVLASGMLPPRPGFSTRSDFRSATGKSPAARWSCATCICNGFVGRSQPKLPVPVTPSSRLGPSSGASDPKWENFAGWAVASQGRDPWLRKRPRKFPGARFSACRRRIPQDSRLVARDVHVRAHLETRADR